MAGKKKDRMLPAHAFTTACDSLAIARSALADELADVLEKNHATELAADVLALVPLLDAIARRVEARAPRGQL